MRTWRGIAARLGGPFTGARREREWKDEFESHLAMHADESIRSGMSAEEATRRAMAESGAMESVKDSMRDQARFVWIDITLRDMRYAFRGLRRSPAVALSTIVSLTLGLGS